LNKKDRQVVEPYLSHDRDFDLIAPLKGRPALNLAVVGAGSLGRWLAARVQASGHEVTLVTRPGSATQQLSCTVKRLEQVFHRDVESAPASALPAGSFQWVFFCIKAKDLSDAALECSHLLSPEGVAVMMANGLGHAESLAEAGMTRSLVASVTYGLCPDGRGAVEERGNGGQVQVGPISSGAPTEGPTQASLAEARSLSALLQEAGLRSQAVEEGAPLIWKKAMLNAGLNPVCALLGQENGMLPESSSFALSIEAAKEVIEVAKVAGVDLSESDPEQLLRDLCRDTATNRCSTLQDLERGQQTEMDWICGAVTRIAERSGIDTPANRLLAKLVQDAEVASVAI
jgi:2-dehydropantoate 2-reductase